MPHNDHPRTDCDFIMRCPMFPLFQSLAALNAYKQIYCQGRFQDCARYALASKGQKPPQKLLPDGGEIPLHWLEQTLPNQGSEEK